MNKIVTTECEFCGKSRQLCYSTTMGCFCRNCIITILNEFDEANETLWEVEREQEE